MINGVDFGIRPRQVFEGSDVNLYPFTKSGREWLEQNKQRFIQPMWSHKERCLKLSKIDSTDRLPDILQALQDDGLKIKFYGRLTDLNKYLPVASVQTSIIRSNRARIVCVSALVQIILFAEPMWRAIKLGGMSTVFTSVIASAATIFVLLATVYRKTWARDFLAVLAIGGLAVAIFSGDLFAIDQGDRFLAAVTSIPNLIAVALLYTPSVDPWFANDANAERSEAK